MVKKCIKIEWRMGTKTEYVERTNHLLDILNQIVMIEIVVQSMTMTVLTYSLKRFHILI